MASSSNIPLPSDEPQKIYFPSSTRSKLLHADYRMSQKAYDYDSCGKMARSYGCSGHGLLPEVVKRVPQTCKQRFTKCCEPRVHRQRMEKHEDIIEMMMTLKPGDWDDIFPKQISFITIRKPMRRPDGEYDTEKALAIGHSMKEALKRIVTVYDGEREKSDSTSELSQFFIKLCLKGFVDGNAIYQGIYWGPHEAPSRIRWALLAQAKPDAEIEVTTEPNRSAERLFSEMLHIIVPDDEVEQAKLEIAFHEQDLVFYSQRLNSEAIADYGLFPWTKPQGNDPEAEHQNRDGCYLEIIPTCQKCGKQADMISEPHPVSATSEEISHGRWEKVFQRKH